MATSAADVVTPETMPPPTPKSAKPTRVNVTYNTPGDDLMVLLIATADMKFDYKAMSAMDPHNRTASALEHRFRGFRAAAKALKEKKKDEAEDKTLDENGIVNGEADGSSLIKGEVVDNKKTNTPARKTPVKASPRGKKGATAKDDAGSGPDQGTPSKKTKAPRKRPEKVTDADENLPAKKRRTSRKAQLEANENEVLTP